MHLDEQLRGEALFPQPARHLDHRELDDVSGRALHGMVHRRALPKPAQVRVARMELGNVALAAEHRLCVPALARLLDRGVQVRAHAGIGLEVTVDHVLCLAERYAKALREAKRLLPVDDAEVHRLRAGAKLGRHFLHRDAEHAARRRCVEIGAAVESRDQVLVTRQVREQAKLDLRVVSREKQRVLVERHEALANVATELSTHGDVLQIRV